MNILSASEEVLGGVLLWAGLIWIWGWIAEQHEQRQVARDRRAWLRSESGPRVNLHDVRS